MKKLIRFLLILSVSCITKNNFGQTTPPDKFDIKKFDSEKINHEVNYINTNGTKVQQIEFSDVFEESFQALNSNFVLFNIYFKKSGKLKSTGKEFSSCNIGLWNEYNESGKLVKQTNWDENYSFSIYDLAARLKNELGIDILHAD